MSSVVTVSLKTKPIDMLETLETLSVLKMTSLQSIFSTLWWHYRSVNFSAFQFLWFDTKILFSNCLTFTERPGKWHQWPCFRSSCHWRRLGPWRQSRKSKNRKCWETISLWHCWAYHSINHEYLFLFFSVKTMWINGGRCDLTEKSKRLACGIVEPIIQ